MAEPATKKRTCVICGTEHKVGEPCPQCAWDQEKEEAMAKAEVERKRLREQGSGPRQKKSWFEY